MNWNKLKPKLYKEDLFLLPLGLFVGFLCFGVIRLFNGSSIVGGIVIFTMYLFDGLLTNKVVRSIDPKDHSILEGNQIPIWLWKKFGYSVGNIIFSIFALPTAFFIGYFLANTTLIVFLTILQGVNITYWTHLYYLWKTNEKKALSWIKKFNNNKQIELKNKQ